MSKPSKHILRTIQASVPVLFMEEDSQWIAYCPPLDLSTYGDTMGEAKKAFEDALQIFFDETVNLGTLERELIQLGWTLASTIYYPPPAHKSVHNLDPRKVVDKKINIPVYA